MTDKIICPDCGKQVYRQPDELILCKNPIHVLPKEKPPYSCPLSAYGEGHRCDYPNCRCKWHL